MGQANATKRFLSQIRAVEARGINFFVRTPWGVMRRFVRRLAEIESAEVGKQMRASRVEEATQELLAEVVVDWEGPADEHGHPIPWSAERLDDLDAATVAELVRKLAAPPEELGTKKDRSG